jgi:3-hydroxybutyryl-CoA dehydratase
VNEYRWSDLSVGMRQEFQAEVTAELVDAFIDLTGDVSPLHCDREFALQRGFRDRVVHGMLTASWYSTLVGVYLPGKFALLHGLDIDFTRPVFPGDTLTVSGTIAFMSEAVSRFEIAAEIRNQHFERVSRAKIRVGVHEP